MYRNLIIIVAVVFAVRGAIATEVSIPLPLLAGDYEARPDIPPSFGVLNRHCTVTFPADVEHIDSMRFLASGQCTFGSQHCEAGEPPIPFRAEFALIIVYSGSFVNTFNGSIRPAEGDFFESSEIVFGGSGQPDSFDCLLNRPVNIHLECIGFTYCYVLTDFYGTLNEIGIELTGSVPVSPSTLSEIKSLFR